MIGWLRSLLQRPKPFQPLIPKPVLASARIVLFCSYSTLPWIPAYVRYSLERLAKTGMQVFLLTNERSFAPADAEWLEQQGITLCMLRNDGFDFGMWGRFLRSVDYQGLERLWLINDSVVFFRDVFSAFLQQAEASDADAFGMTENLEYAAHLQSWCLYLKAPAIAPACEHVFAGGIINHYPRLVRTHEIGLSTHLRKLGFRLQARYREQDFPRPILYMYPELISAGCGFVKRKMLEKSFADYHEAHIRKIGLGAYLDFDYRAHIVEHGQMDQAFKPEQLQTFKA